MRRATAVRVVGPWSWIILPALLSMAATLLLATPVEVFGLRLPQPIIPMVLAFAWPLIRPSMLAPIVLLLLGLFLDLLWRQPLGLAAVSLLSVYAVVLLSRSFLMGQETSVLFVWYSVGTLLAFILTYVIVTLQAANPPSVLSWLASVVPTLLLFPFADRLIERFEDGDVRFR